MNYVNPYYVYVLLCMLKEKYDVDGAGVFDGISESVEFAVAEILYKDFLQSEYNACEDSEHDEINKFLKDEVDEEGLIFLIIQNA